MLLYPCVFVGAFDGKFVGQIVAVLLFSYSSLNINLCHYLVSFLSICLPVSLLVTFSNNFLHCVYVGGIYEAKRTKLFKSINLFNFIRLNQTEQ